MNKKHIIAMLAIASLTFGAAALGQTLSDSKYHSIKKTIAVDFQSALTHCTTYAYRAKKICLSLAKSDSKLAIAELDAQYHPSNQADYKVNMIKANTSYTLSEEKCKTQISKLKVICLKAARSTLMDAELEAQSQLVAPSSDERDDADSERDHEDVMPFPVTLHGYL